MEPPSLAESVFVKVKTQMAALVQRPWWQLLGGALAIGVILFCVIYFPLKAFRDSRYLSTEKNQKRVLQEQVDALNGRWTGLKRNVEGLDAAIKQIPNDQQLLINTNVLGVRLAGYLGPYNYGVFSEDHAVRLAIASGARCLVLEIDYLESEKQPVLIYRNSFGIKYSMNTGSIEAVAKSLAARAFSNINGAPANVVNDPFFLVTYFVRTPNPVKETREYARFLGAVAKQLQPLQPFLLGMTPQGDTRRQAIESQLFFYPTSMFQRQIIHLTNADTSVFRKLAVYGLEGQLGPEEDLDLLTHVRLSARESPNPLGITSIVESSKRPAAVLTTPSYWLNIPPDRVQDAIANTKTSWTLCLWPVAERANPTEQSISDLLNTYGINCLPMVLFDTKERTDLWTGKSRPYESSAWRVKPEPLRFIPPTPTKILAASKETDSGKGKVVSPTF